VDQASPKPANLHQMPAAIPTPASWTRRIGKSDFRIENKLNLRVEGENAWQLFGVQLREPAQGVDAARKGECGIEPGRIVWHGCVMLDY
jgi:hypothetical protein